MTMKRDEYLFYLSFAYNLQKHHQLKPSNFLIVPMKNNIHESIFDKKVNLKKKFKKKETDLVLQVTCTLNMGFAKFPGTFL